MHGGPAMRLIINTLTDVFQSLSFRDVSVTIMREGLQTRLSVSVITPAGGRYWYEALFETDAIYSLSKEEAMIFCRGVFREIMTDYFERFITAGIIESEARR
jgi:hypothetical protein